MEFNLLRMEPNGDYYRLNIKEMLPFKSLVWEESFNGIGKMQAVFPKSIDGVRNIRLGDWAYIRGTGTIMYIHSFKETDTELWVYGYEAKAVLQKEPMRPFSSDFWVTGYVTQSIETAWYEYVTGAYKIPSWMEGQALSAIVPALPEANTAALEYWDVYNCIRQCCALVGAGYRLKYLPDLGLTQLVVRQGQDLSDDVVFARKFGNVSGLTYALDDQAYVRYVKAIGLDVDGETEIIQTYGDSTYNPLDPTGAYLDLRLEFPRPEDMSLTDYEAALLSRAHMSCVARSVRSKLEIKDIDTSEFGTRYQLGDIVGIALPEHGISRKARVATLRRTIEGNRDTLTLDLSTAL